MALTHTTAVRNGLADYTVDQVDVGTIDANGDLVIMTGADSQLAILAMANPAFGNAAIGVATAAAISDDTNASAGTAAKCKLQNRDNTEIVQGSVTATGGGGDIELSSVAIGAGDTISISSLTYTAPV